MELKDNWKRLEVAEYLDKGPLHEKRMGLNFICDAVAKILRKNSRYQMLDVACGPGSVLKRMLHRGIEVNPERYLGIDYSNAALQRAKEHFPDYKFENIDVVEESLPSFDLVVCADLMQHLANPRVLVDNLYQATKRFCIVGTWAKFNGEDWEKYHICELEQKISCIHRVFDLDKLETGLLEWDWEFTYIIRKDTEFVGVLKKKQGGNNG